MLIYLGIALFMLFCLFLFSSPRLSPIPYFPTNKKDIPLIIKAFELKNNQTIIDLGAGDGIVIFEAAKNSFLQKLNTEFVAIEINPILILVLHLRRFFHPNRKNIKIIWGDMFRTDLKDQRSKIKVTTQNSKFITFYIYISPWLIEKLIKNLKLKIKNFHVVSYFYEIKNRKPKKILSGQHKVFIY